MKTHTLLGPNAVPIKKGMKVIIEKKEWSIEKVWLGLSPGSFINIRKATLVGDYNRRHPKTFTEQELQQYIPKKEIHYPEW